MPEKGLLFIIGGVGFSRGGKNCFDYSFILLRKVSIVEKFFQLKENNTTVGKEVVAGLTTFFAMAYIIAVNPTLLSQSGMEWGAVFLATILAAIVGTLIMGLVANVPYAQAPGMGLNAFFVYTVCGALEFTWQQALSMVFICGLLNIAITVSKVRKYIMKSIPLSMQNAISGGIGIFVAYIGFLNVGIVNFDGGVPALSTLNQPQFWVFLIGMALIVILLVRQVKGAILISIVATTLIGIPFGVTTPSETVSFTEACQALPSTVLAIFKEGGITSLFSDPAKLPLVLITIFSFSISDTFDTIGTFIGTGRRSGIFSEEDELFPLVTLTKEDPYVIWDEKGERVLLLTWHDYDSQCAPGEEIPSQYGEIWATSCGEMLAWFEEHRGETEDWNLRLAQLLGVHEGEGYTRFTAFWVAPEDVIRPAYCTDVTAQMENGYDLVEDGAYKEWFDGNIIWSYFESDYPWTRLGYTYDWSGERRNTV
mgnify:CR=1 FL=1